MTTLTRPPMSTLTDVRRAHPGEAAVLADTLAAAFFDDPVLGWVFPEPARRRALLPGVFELEARELLAHDETYTTEAGDVVALWTPPNPPQKDQAEEEALVEALRRAAAEHSDAVLTVVELIETHRPSTPHWYLELLGTRPERQGRGLGSRALRPVLDRCDREGMPAYLESSNPRNVPFYERHGFAVTGAMRLPDGPTIRHMWREPRM